MVAKCACSPSVQPLPAPSKVTLPCPGPSCGAPQACLFRLPLQGEFAGPLRPVLVPSTPKHSTRPVVLPEVHIQPGPSASLKAQVRSLCAHLPQAKPGQRAWWLLRLGQALLKLQKPDLGAQALHAAFQASATPATTSWLAHELATVYDKIGGSRKLSNAVRSALAQDHAPEELLLLAAEFANRVGGLPQAAELGRPLEAGLQALALQEGPDLHRNRDAGFTCPGEMLEAASSSLLVFAFYYPQVCGSDWRLDWAAARAPRAVHSAMPALPTHPQFYPFAENNAVFGEGFTEWSLVRSSPDKNMHGTPVRKPTQLGYYDLRNETVRQLQGELAAAHGVDGFLVYHYWLENRVIMGEVVERMLQDGQPNRCTCGAASRVQAAKHAACLVPSATNSDSLLHQALGFLLGERELEGRFFRHAASRNLPAAL